MQDAARRITSLGWPGHLIFIACLIYTGLPFAYGWSFLCIACGYTFGWWAILTANIGTQCGCLLGVAVSRHCMQASVQAKVATLPPGWVRRIGVVQAALSTSRTGYMFLTALLRNSGVITFGIINAMEGALTNPPVPYHVSMVGVLIAAQVGRALRGASP